MKLVSFRLFKPLVAAWNPFRLLRRKGSKGAGAKEQHRTRSGQPTRRHAAFFELP